MTHDPSRHLLAWERTVILEPLKDDYYGIYQGDRGTFARTYREATTRYEKWDWELSINNRFFSRGHAPSVQQAVDEIERQFACWLAGVPTGQWNTEWKTP